MSICDYKAFACVYGLMGRFNGWPMITGMGIAYGSPFNTDSNAPRAHQLVVARKWKCSHRVAQLKTIKLPGLFSAD